MNLLLVRAVAIDEGRLLVARAKGANFVFLPGGHVEAGESLRDALKREFMEELGATPVVGRYLGFVEHEWVGDGKSVLELNHCFTASCEQGIKIESREAHLSFEWVHLIDLPRINLQPPTLVALISRHVAGNTQVWAEPKGAKETHSS
jgi:8-oxo-dGTP pyrophosphatase MutT (NUDIX family)